MLDETALASQLADVARPVAEARGLPSALYTDPAAFELERARVFHGGWTCVALAADAPEPGDAVPIDLLGAPLLLVRDREGALRLHQNVCRHRGMILVREKRNFGGVIRCPYHSWCYSLDGRLRATPHVGGPGLNACDSIDRDATGLVPVAIGEFMGLVFADLAGAAGPFERFIAPLRARWTNFADRPLHHAADSSFTLDLRCNWKLAVENYCESYHLPWVHPGLNSYSRLEDHYNIEAPRSFSGQGTRVYAPQLGGDRSFPDFPGLSERWDRAAEYVSLFPNVLLGVHRDHVFAIRLEPKAADRTVEHVDIFYADADAAAAQDWRDLRARNARLWKEVFVEDVFAVEGMQRGRSAPGFDGGVFSPAMDSPTHLFHDWAAARLA